MVRARARRTRVVEGERLAAGLHPHGDIIEREHGHEKEHRRHAGVDECREVLARRMAGTATTWDRRTRPSVRLRSGRSGRPPLRVEDGLIETGVPKRAGLLPRRKVCY